MNEKEKYHFKILNRIALENSTVFDKIALEFDLNENQIKDLIEFLDGLEQKEFHYSELEEGLKRISESLNCKSIIKYLHENKQYRSVVHSYLKSMKNVIQDLSMDYAPIAKELGI